MAALTCDLCGGKLIMGSGGVATCDSCGMEYNLDRMKEKIQEIKGTVRVDNTHLIGNYLELAQNAIDANNNEEAETYCNKILEIDPTNYEAWMIKGEATAWQTSLQKSRVNEGIMAFIKGFECAPEEKKGELAMEASDQIERLAKATLSLHRERFEKWPDHDEASDFIDEVNSLRDSTTFFSQQTGEISPVVDVQPLFAEELNKAVLNAWNNVVWPEYNGTPDNRAGESEWNKFVKRADNCLLLLKTAIEVYKEKISDDNGKIVKYETLCENAIFIHKEILNSSAWDYSLSSNGKKIWRVSQTLNTTEKSKRQKVIDAYTKLLNEFKSTKAAIEKAKQDEQRKKYWEKHANEKSRLESEKKSIKAQIAKIEEETNNQIADLDNEQRVFLDNSEIKELSKKVQDLTHEKASLGIFSGKKKDALQKQIDQLTVKLNEVSKKNSFKTFEIQRKIKDLRWQADQKIKRLKNRSIEIDEEFARNR